MTLSPPAAGAGGAAPRQPLKCRGRTAAKDDLRARCLVRVREGRQQLIWRLRELSDAHGSCAEGLRAVAREVVSAEATDGASGGCGDMHLEESDEHFIDTVLALEEEIRRELELEELEEAGLEAERLLEAQNEEDCWLYEQHLRGGVPCPLCGLGRLEQSAGELRCPNCPDMRSALMDEAMTMEDVAELLGAAEERHWGGGCSKHPRFEVCHDYGAPVLYLTCHSCGWHEGVL
mmetsp:Transcript_89073/g.252538  ORF Transcript_89073/g.252538 Transcript_89073/m.252538 type:complete len:233 (+) Transcript_89073:67-765(+)